MFNQFFTYMHSLYSKIQFTAHRSALTAYCMLIFILYISMSVISTQAQTNTELQQAIAKLDSGNVRGVKQQLPDFITKYQNDPAVLYLQGRLASNGNEAKQYYQSIVTNFPTSEYADDALYKLYQYNYAMGLYRSANALLQDLAKNYPNSPYVKSIPQAGIPKVDKPLTTAREMNPSARTIPQQTATPTKPSESIKQNESIKTVANSSQDKYTLQVGAFSTSENAEKLKDSFEQKGYQVEVANKVQNGKSLYKVWIGSYKTHDSALKASKDVKSKYRLNAMVIERF